MKKKNILRWGPKLFSACCSLNTITRLYKEKNLIKVFWDEKCIKFACYCDFLSFLYIFFNKTCFQGMFNIKECLSHTFRNKESKALSMRKRQNLWHNSPSNCKELFVYKQDIEKFDIRQLVSDIFCSYLIPSFSMKLYAYITYSLFPQTARIKKY